jgi:hypothetical protein
LTIARFRHRVRGGALVLAALVLMLWALAPAHGHSGPVSTDRCAACTLSRHCPTVLAEEVEPEGPSLFVTTLAGEASSVELPLCVFEKACRAPPA